MYRFTIASIILLTAMVSAGSAQEKPKADQKYDVKRCTPKAVSHPLRSKQKSITVQEGEKSTSFSPVIAFEILESGEVAHAYVKRSSGIASIDKYALNWIQATKYNSRSGCGVIETQADVVVDFF